MLVQISKVGEQEIIHTFPPGSHVLGRGDTLQCNDKRVSRNHATIDVTDDSVNITSTHINPCFLKDANSKTITILKQHTSKKLNDGDAFALLPEDFWFKIKVVHDDLKTENGSIETLKRSASCEDDVLPDKKLKTEVDHINTSGSSNEPTNFAQSVDQIQENIGEIEAPEPIDIVNGIETTAEVPEEEIQAHNDSTLLNSNNTNLTKDDQENNQKIDDKETGEDLNKPDLATNAAPDFQGTSSSDTGDTKQDPKTRRDRCCYGMNCYRKNPAHHQEFSHPGDSDFESDPDDNRPTCSYGAKCYRKNKAHRKNYKHPLQQLDKQTKRSRKKVNRGDVATSQDLRDLSDFDDEEEDPFIADDDSDEYVESSDTDDSDWTESQDVDPTDEDSQNIKRLQKEAKRFLKK